MRLQWVCLEGCSETWQPGQQQGDLSSERSGPTRRFNQKKAGFSRSWLTVNPAARWYRNGMLRSCEFQHLSVFIHRVFRVFPVSIKLASCAVGRPAPPLRYQRVRLTSEEHADASRAVCCLLNTAPTRRVLTWAAAAVATNKRSGLRPKWIKVSARRMLFMKEEC